MKHLDTRKEKRGTTDSDGLLRSLCLVPRLSGFTLIEAIMTLAIFTIISAAVVSSIVMLYKGNRYAMEQAIAVENARRGIDQMVRDIREASYSDTGAYPIVNIGSTTMAFYSDLDRDNDVELIRLYLDGTSFKKRVTNPTGSPAVYNEANGSESTLSQNVRNIEQGVPIFEYFNSAGVKITSYGNVTPTVFVKISLIVNVNPETLPNEYVLRSSAAIRNLKVNL